MGRNLRSFAIAIAVWIASLGAEAGELPRMVRDWVETEQSLIDRTVDESLIYPPSVHHQRQIYRPEAKQWFNLPGVWIPEDAIERVERLESIPEVLRSRLVRQGKAGKEYLYFIHPESRAYFQDLLKKYPVCKDFEATATSSSRTLWVQAKDDPKLLFMTKVSLDVNLGGVRRTVPRGEVVRSVGSSQYFDRMRTRMGQGFQQLPEVMGANIKGMERGGQIIRLIPKEVIDGETGLIPLFSLYAKPDKGEPLLLKLAAKAKLSPDLYFRKQVLEPFIKAWTQWAVKGGLVVEAHAQNILAATDAAGSLTGQFYLRDGGGYNIDSASPLVDQREIRSLPFFENAFQEYHFGATAKAQAQSLNTYFKGGFLHNVDRLFVERLPGYRPGEVYRDLNRILREELGQVWPPIKKLSEEALEETDVVLNQIKRGLDGSNKSCTGSWLRSWLR